MSVDLAVVWLHVLGAVVWIGGLAWQTHALLPAARRGQAAAFAAAVRRGRGATWTAIALVVLTGFYNVTRLGPVERVMESGAGMALAGKFLLVILAVTVAAQRDFGQVALLQGSLATGEDPSSSLRRIAWLDRAVLLLAATIIYLGLLISRA